MKKDAKPFKLQIPDGGYHGEYLKDVAMNILADNEAIAKAVNDWGAKYGIPRRDFKRERAIAKAKREVGGETWFGYNANRDGAI